MDADERTQLDRREQGDDAAEDVREEYTSYQKGERPKPARSRASEEASGEASEEAEADRESELQPRGQDDEAG